VSGPDAPAGAGLPPTARELAERLVEYGGGEVMAVILYGSQLHRSSPDVHSAWDLVVIVEHYPAFHRAMRDAGAFSRSPALMNLMGAILPPYVTAFAPWGDGRPLAKCLVLRRDQFRRAMGPAPRDHFLKGRLVQHVCTVWTKNDDVASDLEDILADARRETLNWTRPFLGERSFDAETFTREMLAVSFAGEVRPESSDRVREVWTSQEDWIVPTFEGVLAEAAGEGVVLEEEEGVYRFAHPASAWERWRRRGYFFRSKVRGVARWFKHMITFNDWQTYIVRKVERRTGMKVELTPAERRWPLLLLWPKVFKVLREGRGMDRRGDIDA
jgi:hypothetical protein